MIYHQTVRYAMARDFIEKNRTKDSHTILEIGAGAHGNLAKFLPNDKIVFLDIDLPQEVLLDERFVIGDAANLVYEDNSFDFVLGLDVLEHIPKNEREKVVKESYRVAKEGIFFSMPYSTESGDYNEKYLKHSYHCCGKSEPVWIDEHIDCQLPSIEEVIDILANNTIQNYQIDYGVKASLMRKMMYLESMVDIPEMMELLEIVNAEYIDNILKLDNGYDYAVAQKMYVKILKSEKYQVQDERIGKQALQIIEDYEKRLEERINTCLQLAVYNRALNKEDSTRLETEGSLEVEENSEVKKNSEVRMNVLLITFNHSKFIRETLESILKQETSFAYNVIVADDCSTDDTLDIIKDCAENSDVEFVYLDNDTNLGIIKNYKRAFSACTAKYIAVMEGDDLWIAEDRLQQHYDFLEEHGECSMSFNRYIVKDFEKNEWHVQPEASPQKFQYITGHDLAYRNLIGNFSTCVYRKSAIDMLPESMYDMHCYDWLTNIMISKMGYIGYLMQTMNIYRIHSNGVWSGQNAAEQNKELLSVIDEYDEFTDYEFTGGFQAYKARVESALLLDKSPIIQKNKAYKQKLKKILRVIYRILDFVPSCIVFVIKGIVPKPIQSKYMSIRERVFNG